MGLAVAIFLIVVNFLVVMMAISALGSAGLEREQARLQVIAAFFGAGTIDQSDDLPRRKVLSAIMVLGRIGFIMILGAVVLSVKDAGVLRSLINLLIIGGVFYLCYWLTELKGVVGNLPGDILAQKSTPETEEPASPVEEILKQPEGYGLATVKIRRDSSLVGLPLSQLGLKEGTIVVLSIEREKKLLPFPKSWYKLQSGDKLMCYGLLETINDIV